MVKEKFEKEELLKKFNVDLGKLEKEQKQLAGKISLEDDRDFSKVVRIGGFSNVFSQNKIISALVVIDENFEVVEEKYFSDKVRFPYIPGLRAYRELPSMLSCLNKVEEKPELIFIHGHGISHPRLGLASHFSLLSEIPTIGVADSLLVGEVKEDDIIYEKKIIGKVLNVKEGSKPVYISPGNLISLKTAFELTKKFVRKPHKLPEPLRMSHKYAREIMKEIFNV